MKVRGYGGIRFQPARDCPVFTFGFRTDFNQNKKFESIKSHT
jgi:hypothetical protein